jgi:hypothetical protein
MKPLLIAVNPEYFYKVLEWKKIEYEKIGHLFKSKGFTNYNHLIDINRVFSTSPRGDLVDRTCTINSPLKFKVNRPWQIPTANISFDKFVENRVNLYTQTNSKLNLCWSGGIDSTCMIVGFLKYATNLSQLRVLYTPYSLYEHKEFYEFLQKNYPEIEYVDLSGTVYIDRQFDGLFISGHGSDEFTASVDESFYDALRNGINTNWKDYFLSKNSDTKLIDFCEEHFAKSGRTIKTILEARWWFYSSTKTQYFVADYSTFTMNQPTAKVTDTSGFFDSFEFESYVYYNLESIIDNNSYQSYKHFMKEYIFAFDGDKNYFENSKKHNSGQFKIYLHKKLAMLDLRWVALLEDNTAIRTKNLPLFSKKEFAQMYGNSLDYLFNEPEYE